MEKRARILVVDDSPVNLAAAEQKLRDRYEVIPLNSGMRALRYLRSETPPDLILLDILMAGKDGIDTLKEIRSLKNAADIPVIMLTGVGERGRVVQSSRLGACDYVLKPFNSDDLFKRIERALRRKKQENVEEKDEEYVEHVENEGYGELGEFGEDEGYGELGEFGEDEGYGELGEFGEGEGYGELGEFGEDEGYGELGEFGEGEGYGELGEFGEHEGYGEYE